MKHNENQKKSIVFGILSKEVMDMERGYALGLWIVEKQQEI